GSLVGWWAKQNQSGRHLWPGIATSRINSTVDPGRPASEILNQIALTWKTLGRFGHGHSHWSISALRQNRGGVTTGLKNLYREKAVVPASPWLGKSPPPPPRANLTLDRSGVTLRWEAAAATRRWVLQTKTGSQWRTDGVFSNSRSSVKLSNQPDSIALRGISPTGIAGTPTIFKR
ncbi:MAG: hypothetical protein AAF514_23590, partial [Verrucomicrobiota bacterium]